MNFFANNPFWQKCIFLRKFQLLFGRITSVLFILAFLSLTDGLISLFRTGSNELVLVTGQSLNISGPTPLKNPLNSDLKARFEPADNYLKFSIEGFYSGYWFGNAMWRGKISALPDTPGKTYNLKISFIGAPASSVQQFMIRIFENQKAIQKASLSVIKRLFDINPFILASILGSLGLAFAAITYYYGLKYIKILLKTGLAEILNYNSDNNNFLCNSPVAIPKGNVRMILDKSGNVIGEARIVKWNKGKLHLISLDGTPPPRGSYVCLKPPEITKNEI